MNIAKKLIIIADNEQKVYNKGAIDVSPQETVSGEEIRITDISPIEHNMAVKISGVEDLSTVKLYKQGKNLLSVGIVRGNFTTSGLNTANKTVVSSYGFYLKSGTYTVSGISEIFTLYINGMATTDKKNDYQVIYHRNRKFTIPTDGLYNIQFNTNNGTEFDTTEIENLKLQVELGTTPTEYEPYIEPTVYDVQADGTVEGVTSLYPTTTLYTGTQGAIIDCAYYQDGRKVKENLTDMILSLGGVINE